MKVTFNYHMKSMPAANCHVSLLGDDIGDGRVQFDEIRFYSYKSLVFRVRVDETGAMICENYCPVDYSRATARQVNRFTTELFGGNQYYTFKAVPIVEIPAEWAVDMFNSYLSNGKRKYK